MFLPLRRFVKTKSKPEGKSFCCCCGCCCFSLRKTISGQGPAKTSDRSPGPHQKKSCEGWGGEDNNSQPSSADDTQHNGPFCTIIYSFTFQIFCIELKELLFI